MSAKRTAWHYNRLAESKGLEFLGPLPASVKEKTYWRCLTCGEIAHRSFEHTKQLKIGCKRCVSQPHVTAEDFKKLAAERGFRWAGNRVVSVSASTGWICNTCGHYWQTSFKHIQNGTGCPKCSQKAPKTERDYHNLADSLGLRWIGETLPKNVTEQTAWECASCGFSYLRSYDKQANRDNNIPCRKCEGLKPDYRQVVLSWGRQI